MNAGDSESMYKCGLSYLESELANACKQPHFSKEDSVGKLKRIE